MLRLLSLPLLLTAICCHSEENVIELSAADVWRYNHIVFHSSHAAPVPVAVFTARNASAVDTDHDLVHHNSSVARIETGGVPVRAVDSLLAAQLFGNDRFVFDSTSPLQVHIVVRDYVTPYQRIHSYGLPNKLANMQAYLLRRWLPTDELMAAVQLQMVVHDKRNQRIEQLTIYAGLSPCEKLSGAPWQSVANNEESFWQTYSQTTIGQSMAASIHYAVEWFYQRFSGQIIDGEIEARRGERLQLSLSSRDVKVGDTLALWHRDQPYRVIGHLRVQSVNADHSFAWPIDLHPASIALGDRVMVNRAATPVAEFLPPAPLATCERDKVAKSDDNKATSTE